MRAMGEIPRKMRKGLWSPDEDEKLSRCIAMYMNGSWSDIARKAGLERCGKSCRRRWMNHLRPDLKRGRFTPAEINRVVELHKALGNRWSEIAGHLVGRTDNDVKNLWNTQIKRRLKLEASFDSSVAGEDIQVKVDSRDNDAVSSDSGDESTCIRSTPYLMDHDGIEEMVIPAAAACSSSSSLQRFASDQYEDTLTCRFPSSNGALDAQDSLPLQTALVSPHSTDQIKPIKPVSVFTFPFSSPPMPPMLCSDPQEETLNNLPTLDAYDASGGFTYSPQLMKPLDLYAYSKRPAGAVLQKCISARNHISPVLSSTDLKKLEVSKNETRLRADFVNFPQLIEGDDMGIQSDSVERLDQQECTPVVTVELGKDQQHRKPFDGGAGCGNVIGRGQACAVFEATLTNTNCSFPNMCMEASSCSSTEASTSTRNSSTANHLRSVLGAVSQFGPSDKVKAAAVLTTAQESCFKENWQIMLNEGEVVQRPEYSKELMLDGRSSVLCSSSNQGSSADDYGGLWWSTLEMPSFDQLPNIDVDVNCWQPLSDVNLV